MRVSIVGPVYPYRGGIAHYTALLARPFTRQAHATQVVSFARQYPAFLYPGRSDKDPSRSPLRVDAQYLLDPLYPWTWRRALQSIAGFGPDLAVIQWWTTFWAPAFAALAAGLRRQGIPVVYLVHNVLPHERRPWDAPLARLALKKAGGFVVQTEREGARLLALLPGARACLSPHPVYGMFAGERLPRAQAREQLRLPPDASVLLFFGIVRPYKGLNCLLRALAEPALSELRPHLVVAGEVWGDPSVYQAEIDRLGLGERVHLDDRYIPNEEVPLFFSAADAFAAPYVQGTQSGALKMALGFGLPVVASPRIAADPGLPPGGVFQADPQDPVALAAALRQALQTPRSPQSLPSPGDTQDDWGRMVSALVAAAGLEGEP